MATVTVVPGTDAVIDLAVVRGADAAHANKFGEKYHDTPETYH
jgi:hypothetical protein